MKRVKESYYREHPNWNDQEGLSGCKEFEAYEARLKFQKEQQKKWIEEQIKEKKLKQEQERLEEQAYAMQTLELNRMRGMLEDDYIRKKNEIQESIKQSNQQISKQKKDKVDDLKKTKLDFEKSEVSLVQERGQKRAFP